MLKNIRFLMGIEASKQKANILNSSLKGQYILVLQNNLPTPRPEGN